MLCGPHLLLVHLALRSQVRTGLALGAVQAVHHVVHALNHGYLPDLLLVLEAHLRSSLACFGVPDTTDLRAETKLTSLTAHTAQTSTASVQGQLGGYAGRPPYAA